MDLILYCELSKTLCFIYSPCSSFDFWKLFHLATVAFDIPH